MAKKSRTAKTNPALVEKVVEALHAKKGHDVVSLDLRHIHSAVADWFIICTGDSSTQVEALAGSVEDGVRKSLGEKPWHLEGMTNAEWVLVDYVDVVVHIFQPHARNHYGLEHLWADAIVTEHADV